MRSDGEEAGEPLGEDAKDEEPDTDADEDGTAPFLDRWSGGLEAFHGGLLGFGDEDREVNISATMTTAAVAKATMAAVKPPVVSACPARPARIGPVQPKPARR